MRRKHVVLRAIFALLILSVGCTTKSSNGNTTGVYSNYVLSGDLVTSGYEITDILISRLKEQITTNDPILVASFVNINDLRESSTFGRMLAEYVSSRLSQRGYKVIDMRLRTTSVFMEEGKGEFLLSRDLRDVSKKHNAAAVVVGTYGEAYNGMYVSVRIIKPSDSAVISSCDYGLAMADRAQAILTRSR
jgi:TolB-like protein